MATPNDAEQVARLVRRAASDGVPLAIRGGGHSQSGKSLTQGGWVLDTRGLNQVQLLGDELVRAQGGAPWGQILDALRGTRRLPPVVADIAEVTVGGTLSAGGLGTTSHRHGVQIAHVEKLEVVTGTGERVRCSRSENASLFDAVRGGQGQFGIITEAWLRLRRAGGRLRQYLLRYSDFERFASDLERIVEEGRFDHLRAETRMHQRTILLSAAIEYDDPPDDGQVLEGLGYEKIDASGETDEVARAVMFPKWGFSWRNHHPWRDWFMPWETLPTLLEQPWLDPQTIPRAPGSWTGVYPIRMGPIDAPLFMRPGGERMLSYSVLAVLSRRERAHKVAERLREIDRTLVGLGGKSYLSGDVGYGRREWAEHYGEKLELGIQWKKEFDPKRVFQAEGLPF
ncbi:MAG: FAD-binding oxidoreductase [Proteobacteria bacterium]|nr:FAD-binding oxidoreductase [Pseudomonadota bacterium]